MSERCIYNDMLHDVMLHNGDGEPAMYMNNLTNSKRFVQQRILCNASASRVIRLSVMMVFECQST